MITLQDISFGYTAKRLLFSDVSLQLKPGGIYGLLGSNGVGKSTLLKLSSGLLFPIRGTVDVEGQNPARRNPSLLEKIFFVPEELDLPSTVFEQFVKVTAPFYPDFSNDQWEGYVSAFGLDQTAHFNQMSMGEKKKVYISFALACNTPYLLLDEPTNGLDIPSKSIFRRLLAEVASPEKTIVISTHQARDIENLLDHIIILNSAGILVNASTEEIGDKLQFRIVNEKDTVLYAEESINGRHGVVLNTDKSLTKLNLELFYNAAVQNPDQMQSLFPNRSNQK